MGNGRLGDRRGWPAFPVPGERISLLPVLTVDSRAILAVPLLSTAAILAVVAMFNLLVDPYGLFPWSGSIGFQCRIKSQAGQRAEMYKRHTVERMRPNALVLGNSRAEIGFDP